MKRAKYKTEGEGWSKWHFVEFHSDDPRTLCQGFIYWEGHEGIEAYKEEPVTSLSKITCPECKMIIQKYKSLK